MSRNPKAEARRRLDRDDANWRAAVKAQEVATAARKRSIVAAVEAGYTMVEVGHFIGVTRGHVNNICTDHRLAAMDRAERAS